MPPFMLGAPFPTGRPPPPFDPSGKYLTGWWRAPKGTTPVMAGVASAGISASHNMATNGVALPDVGPSLNGYAAVHFRGPAQTFQALNSTSSSSQSPYTDRFFDLTGGSQKYEVSLLLQLNQLPTVGQQFFRIIDNGPLANIAPGDYLWSIRLKSDGNLQLRHNANAVDIGTPPISSPFALHVSYSAGSVVSSLGGGGSLAAIVTTGYGPGEASQRIYFSGDGTGPDDHYPAMDLWDVMMTDRTAEYSYADYVSYLNPRFGLALS